MSNPSIRTAAPADVPLLLELMRELARYERLEDSFSSTEADLHRWLFSSPVASALIAVDEGRAVGYAVYFRSFSTFLGRPGYWLEDLFVRLDSRGKGIGKALLARLAKQTAGEGCARLEWSVLDWNQSAIDFYRRLGAEVLGDWRICRLEGASLDRFAATDCADAS